MLYGVANCFGVSGTLPGCRCGAKTGDQSPIMALWSRETLHLRTRSVLRMVHGTKKSRSWFTGLQE